MTLMKIALLCALTAFALPAQAATVTLDLTTRVLDFADSSVGNGTLPAGTASR